MEDNNKLHYGLSLRLYFEEKAFGPGVAVGIRAAPDERYDAAHWWQSSQGVRTVIDEFVAYLYARLAFWPPAPAA